MREQTVLVIAVESATRAQVSRTLAWAGYRAAVAAALAEGWRLFFQLRPTIVIVDNDQAGGDIDALTFCRRVREVSDTPVVVAGRSISAKEALCQGADDFLTKPIDPAEMLARLAAVLRRSGDAGRSSDAIAVYADDLLVVNMAEKRCFVDGREVNLSPTEFRLLSYLVRNPGRVLSKEQLLDRVWGPAADASTDNLKLYISYLRRKLEPDPVRPRLLVTCRGVGYRYQPWRASAVGG